MPTPFLEESGSNLITILDYDGSIRYKSVSVEKILGYKPEELIGKKALTLIHPEDVLSVLQTFNTLVKSDEILSLEFRVQRKDGSWCFLESTGRNFQEKTQRGIIFNSRDITKYKEVEAALRQQTEQVRLLGTICNRINQSLKLEDILNTAVTEVRQFLACDRAIVCRFEPDWRGVVSAESVGKRWMPMLTQIISNSSWREPYPNLYEQGDICHTNDIYTADLNQEQLNVLVQLQIKSQLVVPILIHTQQSNTDSNQTSKLWGLLIAHQCSTKRQWQQFEIDLLSSLTSQLGVAILKAQLYQQVWDSNIALTRQVQERTVKLEQKIQQLQDLHTLKDDFLSTVSHELRTPLANMKMAIQMLKIAPKEGRSQRYLEILQAECNREADLINDLLDLQRLEAESYPTSLKEAVNLPDWLPKIVEPFYSRVQERQQTLRVNLAANLPPLISSSTGLGRIVAELLNNACKYTGTGKEIVVQVNYYPTAEPGVPTNANFIELPKPSHHNRRVTATNATGFITFTISNQAEILAKELSRIFEKFYRVPYADSWKQGGTGLGLALVQKLVQQLGGTIQVESGSGWTTFTVKLPVKG